MSLAHDSNFLVAVLHSTDMAIVIPIPMGIPESFENLGQGESLCGCRFQVAAPGTPLTGRVGIRSLPERSVLRANDCDLRADIDIVRSAVVVAIAVRPSKAFQDFRQRCRSTVSRPHVSASRAAAAAKVHFRRLSERTMIRTSNAHFRLGIDVPDLRVVKALSMLLRCLNDELGS
jgi:hypothetical protein